MRTFVHPWDSTALAAVVLVLAAAGVVQLLWRDRRSLAAVIALDRSVPRVPSRCSRTRRSFATRCRSVPVVAFLAVRGVSLVSVQAVPVVAALLSIAGVAIASPVLVAYASEPSPTVRALDAMKAEARVSQPGALAMHQTFVRPLEAEDVGITPQLPSPPRLEWLELAKYWKSGQTGPLWFLADPMRSDLALIDPASRRDSTEFRWPLVARPAFGGMRPSAVRWYRMPAAGLVRRRRLVADARDVRHGRTDGARSASRPDHRAWSAAAAGAARVLIGGRNLAGPNDPAARFTHVDRRRVVPAMGRGAGLLPEGVRHSGRRWLSLSASLMAGSALATLTVQSTACRARRRSRPRSSNSICRTSRRRCGAMTRAGRKRNTAWRLASGAGRAIVRPCALPGRRARCASR